MPQVAASDLFATDLVGEVLSFYEYDEVLSFYEYDDHEPSPPSWIATGVVRAVAYSQAGDLRFTICVMASNEESRMAPDDLAMLGSSMWFRASTKHPEAVKEMVKRYKDDEERDW